MGAEQPKCLYSSIDSAATIQVSRMKTHSKLPSTYLTIKDVFPICASPTMPILSTILSDQLQLVISLQTLKPYFLDRSFPVVTNVHTSYDLLLPRQSPIHGHCPILRTHSPDHPSRVAAGELKRVDGCWSKRCSSGWARMWYTLGLVLKRSEWCAGMECAGL